MLTAKNPLLQWSPILGLGIRPNDKYVCEQSSTQPECTNSNHYCPFWSCTSWDTWQGEDKMALLQKGVATSSCTSGACNLEDSRWEKGHKIGSIHVGHGLLGLNIHPPKSSSNQIFHFFYEEMVRSPPLISVTTRFLTLFSL